MKARSNLKQLNHSFFKRDTVTVAKELLGKIVSVNGFLGRIVETEAYGSDPASHAFKRTERSELMYSTYGHVYVYLIYGMYNCINFTTEEKEVPGAVLIRAVEPLNKINLLMKKRETEKIENLCSGPGKLCEAFAIDRRLNGLRLGGKVKIYDDGFKAEKIGSSARVGITDAKHLEWRFFIAENKFVSKVKI